jgi:hypothetical protein
VGPARKEGTHSAQSVKSLTSCRQLARFYQGELLRRIDPWHRSLGQFFQDEIATMGG